MTTTIDTIKQCLTDANLGNDANKYYEIGISAVQALRQVQCCYRCCLRFVSARDLKLYTVSEQELGSLFSQLLKENHSVDVCTACVGSLQHAENFVETIGERLQQESYQTKNVNLNCTLPISLLSRDHLLRLYLRDTLKLDTLAAPRDPKDPFKHIIAAQIKGKFGVGLWNNGPLRMTVIVEHEPTAQEHMFLTQVEKPVLKVRTKRRKGKVQIWGDSRATVVEALKALKDTEASSLTTIPPAPQTAQATLSEVHLVHESAYVGGRYIKNSREYSQTPWSVKGKKLAENSVSECICEVLKKYYRCDDYKFVSSGREDANVRMLGTGRPFYCELVNPRKIKFEKSELTAMQDEINSLPSKDDVQLRDLTSIKPNDTKTIKEGEEFKRKTYRALVWVSSPVTDEMLEKVNQAGSNPFKIQQNTPVRVFQRRSGIVREKEIHFCKAARPANVKEDAQEAEKHFAVVTLNTQAGTYIKEFVHGDLGRTQPNFASLAGVQAADLIELDVTAVDLAWPPSQK
ncbi:hypothetical protein BDB00DRAFT_917872 [Zychaea mexicana]|uniref:uncharacterized protein n=1 Tax=Zychaea mexicana TaxID=64656 RepID=UPI0022FDDBB8|nr:uncharacterized protein BDB00DRAFT_917872 [Zychaea mexicana]KAI9490191.1 hypothetical protein BDB00DRAFT_917872 [Zychaea mexicana]